MTLSKAQATLAAMSFPKNFTIPFTVSVQAAEDELADDCLVFETAERKIFIQLSDGSLSLYELCDADGNYTKNEAEVDSILYHATICMPLTEFGLLCIARRILHLL